MQRLSSTAISLLRRRLATALTVSLVAFTIPAVIAGERPGLVVGITIEGLSDDYLDLLRDKLGADGFMRLGRDGVVITDLLYGPGIDATAATAMLVTGAPPSINGIGGSRVFDTVRRIPRPLLLSSKSATSGSTEAYSPDALTVSTTADELRVAGGGIGRAYSFAAEPQQAILMAGHAGNAAFWISDINGSWTTTSYYKDVPTSVSGRNFSRPLSSRLDTLKWTPSIPPGEYPGIPKYKKAYPFRHLFRSNDTDRYRAFKSSATGNAEVTSMAVDLISSLALGRGDETDMLSLAYTVAPYAWSKDPDSRLETLDAYLRLDADLARLFKAIDTSGPGMGRTLVWIAGVPAPPSGKRDDERFRIPYGRFSPRKAVSLLNVYLMAIHGNGEWVSGMHDRQIYLNRPLIKEHGIDETVIRREAADFLTRMTGVVEAMTIDDITARRSGSQSERLLRNTAVNTAGDILVTIAPGWEIADESAGSSSTPRPQVSRLGEKSYPAFILAPGLKPETIYTPTDACVIAPTVSRLLRIRSPNATSAAPLRLQCKP